MDIPLSPPFPFPSGYNNFFLSGLPFQRPFSFHLQGISTSISFHKVSLHFSCLHVPQMLDELHIKIHSMGLYSILTLSQLLMVHDCCLRKEQLWDGLKTRKIVTHVFFPQFLILLLAFCFILFYPSGIYSLKPWRFSASPGTFLFFSYPFHLSPFSSFWFDWFCNYRWPLWFPLSTAISSKSLFPWLFQ